MFIKSKKIWKLGLRATIVHFSFHPWPCAMPGHRAMFTRGRQNSTCSEQGRLKTCSQDHAESKSKKKPKPRNKHGPKGSKIREILEARLGKRMEKEAKRMPNTVGSTPSVYRNLPHSLPLSSFLPPLPTLSQSLLIPISSFPLAPNRVRMLLRNGDIVPETNSCLGFDLLGGSFDQRVGKRVSLKPKLI